MKTIKKHLLFSYLYITIWFSLGAYLHHDSKNTL